MPFPQRHLLLGAAVVFGAFGAIALVARFNGMSDSTLSVVAGICAYAFLAYALGLVVWWWRRRSRGIAGLVEDFVRHQPAVLAAVGSPVSVGPPGGDIPAGRGPAQANIDVVVSGPDGLARVDLVMARIGSRWEVLSATLVSDGARVPLRGGPAEGA